MSPWTALLESLHSALIDELTDRHPDPKPELGLPMRKPRFELPEEGLSSVICASVDFGGPQTGCVSLCLCPEAVSSLKLDAGALWEAVVKRAGSEFMRRNIRPRLGQPLPCTDGGVLPSSFGEPQRMVWIPFRIQSGRVFLGLGA